MLTDRQRDLLKIVVEEYVKTAKAISSNSLCEKLDCSSATIRNEMSYLEDIGLLIKAHISSGRIPSDEGYRYYVDNIMQPKNITGEEMLKLQTIFKNNSLALPDAIMKSMEIISEMTSYAAIVLGKSSDHNLITKVEVIPLSPNKIVAILITDKGHVESRNITFKEDVSVEEVKQTVDIINKLIIGVPLNEVSEKLEFDVKPVISKFIKQHDVLYTAFYKAFQDLATDSNYFKVSGTSNILKQPEFDNVQKIRKIIDKFDDFKEISKIESDEDDIKIFIGSESSFDDEIGIIKTKYSVGNDSGTIAIIGPKRMEYDRVQSLMEYIKETIGGKNE